MNDREFTNEYLCVPPDLAKTRLARETEQLLKSGGEREIRRMVISRPLFDVLDRQCKDVVVEHGCVILDVAEFSRTERPTGNLVLGTVSAHVSADK